MFSLSCIASYCPQPSRFRSPLWQILNLTIQTVHTQMSKSGVQVPSAVPGGQVHGAVPTAFSCVPLYSTHSPLLCLAPTSLSLGFYWGFCENPSTSLMRGKTLCIVIETLLFREPVLLYTFQKFLTDSALLLVILVILPCCYRILKNTFGHFSGIWSVQWDLEKEGEKTDSLLSSKGV